MTFSQSVVTCFKKYVDFSGRATRSEYFYFFLFNSLLFLLNRYVLHFLLGNISPLFAMIVSQIIAWGTLLPGVAVAWRRMHDTGRPGIFILIPIVGLVLVFFDGEHCDNIFGHNPYE